jgi:predicted anti-sigma-YlaC factor YlaD
MIEHVTSWLGPYHDGELQGRRLRQVEEHLEHCAACRTELEQLRKLSALLQESPVAVTSVSPNRFVAQVGLRMVRRQEKPVWQKVLETGWRLTPAGLVGAWAFVQAVFIVAGIALIVLQVGAGIDVLGLEVPRSETWLSTGLSLVLGLMGAELGDTARTILHLLGTLGWVIVLYLIALVVIGMLYWSWLVSLWARRRHQELQPQTS